jgi:hypothetical protein
MRRLIAALAGIALALGAWFVFKPMTPESARAKIQLVGAKAFVQSNFETESWNQIMAGIASGDDRWLQVAQAIAPGTDADSAEQLAESLNKSLIANPVKTLRMFAQGRETALVMKAACFGPVGPAELVRAKDEIRAALARVTDPSLAPAKATCLELASKQAWGDP